MLDLPNFLENYSSVRTTCLAETGKIGMQILILNYIKENSPVEGKWENLQILNSCW